jgi:hypothetical protein
VGTSRPTPRRRSLYALKTNKTLLRNAAGGADSGWVVVGVAESAQDIACATQLWAFNNDRTIYRNDGTPTALRWTRVGRPTGAKQISAGAIGNNTVGLYALNDNNTLWKSPTGVDGSWTQIGLPSVADRISGGGRDVWALNTNKDLYRGNGSDGGWTYLDMPELAKTIADDGSVSSGALWALNNDQSVWHGVVNGGMEGEVCRPYCYGSVVQNVYCDRCDSGLSCGDAKVCVQASAYGQPCLEPEILSSQPNCDTGLTCQSGKCYGNGQEAQRCRLNGACDSGLACAAGTCISPKAKTNCVAGDRNCNVCANNVVSQFNNILGARKKKVNHSWKFNYSDTFAPSNIKPGAAFRVVNAVMDHFQSFIHTNDPARPFAGVHSTDSDGVLFVVRQGESQKRLDSLQWTSTDHPAGMQAIGQFIVYADADLLRVHDMTMSSAFQNRTLPVPSPGIKGGGDGLGGTQLANGDTLIVAGPEKGDGNPTAYRFFTVRGSLLTSSQVTYLGEADSEKWKGYGGLSNGDLDSENLSVIAECGTGTVFIVNATDGIWRLSRVSWAGGKPVVEPFGFNYNDEDLSFCHLRSSGTVWTAPTGDLHFYCHERRVWKFFEGSDSVGFAHYELGPLDPPRPTQPPGSNCCVQMNGICTEWAVPPAECP